MKGSRERTIPSPPPLHTHELLPHTRLNHLFAFVYVCGIIALFYHHIQSLRNSTTTLTSFLLHFSLIVSDAVLAFIWAATQAFRIRPIRRKVFPENLPNVVDVKDYPALDVFICTADPYKEPPIHAVNTALSVLAYDYPMEKITVYISDDGGSMLTLFAFMEAAKFATHWLPFCREKNIMKRCPHAYFTSNNVKTSCPETEKLKMMYETMKVKVESVVDRGFVGDEYITSEYDSQIFKKWTTGFTRQDHPTIIKVLLESGKDQDITDHEMPNLVYVSRQKSTTVHHNYKGGALNVLLRVSATMTNAPLILTLDGDMYSNDPQTPLRALCFFLNPAKESSQLAYIQFPQRFHGINNNDIYASEHKRLFRIVKAGMDGFKGPQYCGTGCFFRRRAFFGGPSSLLSTEIPELDPHHVVDKPIKSEAVLTMAHHVARCDYENGTRWGLKMGIRYGSLVEDFFTGYQLLCEGWNSVFCDPGDIAPFLGDFPITLNDTLGQVRRWSMGLVQVAFSKYSPITFGTKVMGLGAGLCFSQWAFSTLWSIPTTVYTFIPPLALLNRVYIFPQVSSPWFLLYVFLFVGAYGQDCLEYIYYGGTIRNWYNDQRMWMIDGVSSHLFGFMDYLQKALRISSTGFNVTSKVNDDEQSKRYEQGLFDFGVVTPLFVPLTTMATINLVAFVLGLAEMTRHGNWEEMFMQLSLSGLITVNCWPIYDAILLRVDGGKMPAMVTLMAIILAWVLYLASVTLQT